MLKDNISKILIKKYGSNPDLILKNLIKIPDDSKFISKGIIAKTLIKIAQNNPKEVIPKFINYLDSKIDEIKLNAISSLEGLVQDHSIPLKPILLVLQEGSNKSIKKEASKIISRTARTDPKSIKPVIPVILQLINTQESAVKIVLSKSLLELAKESSELLPVRPIINFLSDKDSFIRETGAKILGFIGDVDVSKEIVDALIEKGLADDEWNVREAALTSLGEIIDHVEDRSFIITILVSHLDDSQAWVRRSAINILSKMEEVKASQIPFEKLSNSLTDNDSKVREASAGLLKIYGNQIDRIFDMILSLLEDKSEDVRKSMISSTIEIIEKIGLNRIITNLLKNLSDEGSIEAQRSIAVILEKTAKYEDEKMKKRIISLLKIRCEMSQDPIICGALHKIRQI